MKKVNLKVSAQSGTWLRKAAGSIAVAAMLLLSGCAVHNAAVSSSDTPFYLAYDSEEVMREQAQVATLTSTYGMEIDGVVVNSKNMRSTTASNATKSVVVVDVLPGEHKVRLTNTQSLGVSQVKPVTHNFEAGKVYNVTIKILLAIEENKSAEVAQKIAENRRNNVFEKNNKQEKKK